jgi:aryl carrier-like protein
MGAQGGLLDALVEKVKEMTMMDEVPVDLPLGQLGLDSLVAVELRNWIRRQAGVELALTRIVGAGSLRGLAEDILGMQKP